MKRAFFALPLLCAALIISCSKYDFGGMFAPEGPSVDSRFRQSIAYNDSAGCRTIVSESDSYRFYAFSDAHISGTTRNLDAFVEEYLADGESAPFLLFLGDMVTGGENYFNDFYKHTAALAEKGVLFVTVGNHDLYFNGWKDFVSLFHTSSYWFEVQCPGARDLFIALDSGGGTIGEEQRAWLENLLESKASSCRNIVVFTHTHFFKRDSSQGHTSNFALEETYDLADLFSRYGVRLVLSGHDHTREDTTFRGVRFVIVDSLEDSNANAAYVVAGMGESIDIRYFSIR